MKVLISGAGIAGPCLAFFLSRRGDDVTVLERAPRLRDGGYCVDIRGAALSVIERMGLRERLRPLESDTLSSAAVDARGRIFGRTPRGFGVIDEGDIEIARGDLSRVLYEATRDRVRYRFGERLTAVEQRGDRVVTSLASGERGSFDLVVGADGVHSATRALAFGPEESFVHEMGSAMAIFTVPNHLGLHREQLLFSGIGRIASVKSSNGDRDLTVATFFSVAPGSFPVDDEAAQRAIVARAFRDAGWEFPTLVDAMLRADDFYADVTCQVRMAAHHRGHVVLLGDAACCPSPLSGQGTSLALVGACVLADCLDGDIATGLARHDARMRPFIERNQAIARDIGGGFAPRTRLEAAARDLAMRVLPHLPASHLVMRLAMRGVREAARSIAL